MQASEQQKLTEDIKSSVILLFLPFSYQRHRLQHSLKLVRCDILHRAQRMPVGAFLCCLHNVVQFTEWRYYFIREIIL